MRAAGTAEGCPAVSMNPVRPIRSIVDAFLRRKFNNDDFRRLFCLIGRLIYYQIIN